MERKIGEIFEYNGEWYQCVEDNCAYCSIEDEACEQRIINDVCKLNRIFKKLEKVREPITVNGKKVQLLKTIIANCDNCAFYKDINCDFTCYPRKCYGGEEGTYVEINEDMEDNDDIRPYDELFSPGTVSNTKYLAKEDMEENKLNLKPFDIQKAREGKPVCTRDGHKARIICFDAKDTQPIIGLYEKNIDGIVREYLCSYHTDGRMYDDQDTGYDLMMLPEKKEGWVNVYYDNDASSHRGCRYIYDTKEQAIKEAGSNYITTIKINWEE